MDPEDMLRGVSEAQRGKVRSLLPEAGQRSAPRAQRGAGGFPGAGEGQWGLLFSGTEFLFAKMKYSGDGGGTVRRRERTRWEVRCTCVRRKPVYTCTYTEHLFYLP